LGEEGTKKKGEKKEANVVVMGGGGQEAKLIEGFLADPPPETILVEINVRTKEHVEIGRGGHEGDIIIPAKGKHCGTNMVANPVALRKGQSPKGRPEKGERIEKSKRRLRLERKRSDLRGYCFVSCFLFFFSFLRRWESGEGKLEMAPPHYCHCQWE
jgi:hypothetical protein